MQTMQSSAASITMMMTVSLKLIPVFFALQRLNLQQLAFISLVFSAR